MSRAQGSAAPLDALIVFNPVAARTESTDTKQLLVEALTARRMRHRFVATGATSDSRKVAARVIQRSLEAGCRRVIAVGGDGTVSATAAYLAHSRRRSARATLAIVPTGTANVLARELGIPMAVPEAIDLALDGKRTIDLDAIAAPDRLVFTQVGVGLDAQVIRHTSREDQIRKGRLAYFTTFIRQAVGHRSVHFELDIDGQSMRVRALQIVVANVGALGTPPFTWGPGIDPSDGVIDVCVFTARTVRDRFKLVLGLITGDHEGNPQTQYFHASKRVVISSRRPVLVQGDGEILGRTPITLGVSRRAVRVCVPKNIDAIESTAGAPTDAPASLAAADPQASKSEGTLPVAEPAETLAEDVVTMVAQHSRTWVLQGWARHPLAFLTALDAALFLRINAMRFGSLADRGMILVSQWMHYGEGWAVVAVAMVIADWRRGLGVVAEALPVLWLTMLTVNFPLKRLFGRRRPFHAFVDARVSGPKPDDSSFPSGHTAAAFAGALLFGAHAPQWSPVFYALATLVGFSRIYLGVHYPMDVVIGAGVGTVLAAGFLALLRLAVSLFN